ncbi:topoisomerase IV [Anaerotruncus massiliensis (ex Liu et al. 2021)]|uniref:Topoisomerase IV n=2 Tax=Anaerotruncus TaxID=244127 RepID=A0A498CKY7_9FIRM|nr:MULTISPECIES: DNA gyrase subunit A [Anaerotruncus]MBC3939387.1 topoisomerase IV [Anaerotruncus massiliensis (ex Togo et al. 2019)]RLL09117.1 topoisomerase IV [Anaerotruncus massiliensis (ex Liu et al. 2021)]
MATKKPKKEPKKPVNSSAVIENAGVMIEQPIVTTLESNYMPYAMSVIVSRAIPEIDGFKPSHRKLLYTMYKMGLLSGARTKSANVVGQTMKLNPHGDQAIYETMVRMSRGYEALLHPYVDSKGNFGKAYSRDMAYAASRYTEVKLDGIAAELFRDIDEDTVDMVDNYDNTQKEPTLFPVTFPSILVNSNIGIAVGMASSICPFNLAEVCDTTIALLKNPGHDILETLRAPDFPGGGYIVYNEDDLRKIYATGRGGVRVRSRWSYDKANNCIDITEIPPTATVEAIMDKIVDLVKGGKIREIADMRDETDLSGLKLTLDLKRGADPDALMRKLFRITPLEDTFSCNFNVLIAGMPRVCGVKELIEEWAAFREGCVKRRVYHQLGKKKEKLHLLMGLKKILLDIDKAIRIVRETAEEREVVPNLMIGFGIDEVQAEYVAEIKLRQLNREHILKRVEETDQLKKEIAGMEEILADRKKVRAIIIDELRAVSKKYAKPRKSLLYYPSGEDEEEPEALVPDYPVHLFFTREGYFKKITPQSLRMSGEQKLKEGDAVAREVEATNNTDLLFFTDRQQVYKAKASDFDDGKASVLGDYIPAKLGMDEGENAVYMAVTTDYAGYMLFFFENGKAAKVDLSGYATKTNRKKLLGAYSDASPLAACFQIEGGEDFLMTSSSGRMLLANAGAVSSKTTRTTQGIAVMTQKKNHRVASVKPFSEGMLANPHRFRTKTLPAAGMMPREEDYGEQLTL